MSYYLKKVNKIFQTFCDCTILSNSIKLQVEAISNHEKNLQTCLKTKAIIQNKISDIIKKLKEDERKLLEDINEFEQRETTMMNDNSNRVKELNEINSFCENVANNLEK
jgi:hypothetical protein